MGKMAKDESKYTFPTIKYATQLYDSRLENCFKLEQLNITRLFASCYMVARVLCVSQGHGILST